MKLNHKRIDLLDIEVKRDGDGAGLIKGYGAVFGNVDSYGEKIERGAFAKSLDEWEARGKYPKMLLQHGGLGLTIEDMLSVGKWETMKEDRRGLYVEGKLFALNTDRGQYIYEAALEGELDGLSIGFQVMADKTETVAGEAVRVLTEIKLWEVSLVTFPANDLARISSVKNLSLERMRELESALRDEGLSRKEAERAASAFLSMCQRDVGAPATDPRDEDAAEVLKRIDRLTGSMIRGALRA